MVAYAHDAKRMTVAGIQVGNLQRRGIGVRAILPPVQPGMSVEYLQAAHQDEKYPQGVEPM